LLAARECIERLEIEQSERTAKGEPHTAFLVKSYSNVHTVYSVHLSAGSTAMSKLDELKAKLLGSTGDATPKAAELEDGNIGQPSYKQQLPAIIDQ
jgi:hypothetical protein